MLGYNEIVPIYLFKKLKFSFKARRGCKDKIDASITPRSDSLRRIGLPAVLACTESDSAGSVRQFWISEIFLKNQHVALVSQRHSV